MGNLTKEEHDAVWKFFHNIEKQTWGEIKLAAGGKSKGTNHHFFKVCEFSKIVKMNSFKEFRKNYRRYYLFF